MGATTSLRSSLLAGAALLAGCAPMGPQVEICGVQCTAEQQAQRRAEFISSGITYGAHRSQEYHEARAHSRRSAARWAERDHARRITTAGPDLSAYGPVGESGYMAVAECRRDVAHTVEDWDTRMQFERMCYDLLPVQHREAFYLDDKRARKVDPLIILVPVPTPP